MSCTCPPWYGTQYPWPHHPDCPCSEKNRKKNRSEKSRRKRAAAKRKKKITGPVGWSWGAK